MRAALLPVSGFRMYYARAERPPPHPKQKQQTNKNNNNKNNNPPPQKKKQQTNKNNNNNNKTKQKQKNKKKNKTITNKTKQLKKKLGEIWREGGSTQTSTEWTWPTDHDNNDNFVNILHRHASERRTRSKALNK